jgi:arylsulfatase A-like enzyme
MFTGRWAGEMSGSWLTPLDAAHPVLAERLKAAGYSTAGFVANILYCNRSFGLARGFTHYEDYGLTAGELIVNSSLGRALSESRLVRRMTGNFDILGRKPGAAITDRFLAWESASTRPYFAFLNYFDAHQPYFPPDSLARAFGPTAPRNLGLLELRPYMGKIADAETELTPEQVTAERNAYDATLRYLDTEMDRLLTELERRGRLENTVVIITSDHGEQFMEHGLFDHGNSLYRFATEVPLVMIGAGVPAGAVSAPVTLRDLPATALDLAGLPGGPFPGASLRGFWAGNRTAEPLVSEVWGPGPRRRFQSVIDQGYHAIWSADSAELYAFESDPGETRNLARTPDGSARLEAMRARFREIRPGQDTIP